MKQTLTPETMTEEQIKKIKEELVKDSSNFDTIEKATYLTGARLLNVLFHKAGLTTFKEYVSLGDMLEIEIVKNITLAKI